MLEVRASGSDPLHEETEMRTVDSNVLDAASAAVIEAGTGAHAVLESIDHEAPQYRLVPVPQWVKVRETAEGARWRVVAAVSSDGVVTEL